METLRTPIIMQRHPRHFQPQHTEQFLMPNSGMVRRTVRLDREGFVWVDDKNMTTLPGLFAAGDVTTVFAENILVAIGDGTRAAINAYDYLLVHPQPAEVEPGD